jgi:hypothetical protein
MEYNKEEKKKNMAEMHSAKERMKYTVQMKMTKQP